MGGHFRNPNFIPGAITAAVHSRCLRNSPKIKSISRRVGVTAFDTSLEHLVVPEGLEVAWKRMEVCHRDTVGWGDLKEMPTLK